MASRDKPKVVNLTAQTTIASDLRLAQTFFARLQGLLMSPPLMPGQGLIIEPCSSIHMFGMKFAIDVIFIDNSWQVVGLVENIAPGKVSRIYPSARACIEVPVGTISGTNTQLGDQLRFEKP